MEKDKSLINAQETNNTPTTNTQLTQEANPDALDINVFKAIERITKIHDIKLTEAEFNFTFLMSRTNSVEMTKKVLNLADDDFFLFYKNPQINEVLRLLKFEKTKRKFFNKMLTLDELGSFLSSELVELDIDEANKKNISYKDKIETAKTIIEIHKIKNSIINQPQTINNYQFLETQLDDKINTLSIKEIKSLLIPSKPDKQQNNAQEANQTPATNTQPNAQENPQEFINLTNDEKLRILNSYNLKSKIKNELYETQTDKINQLNKFIKQKLNEKTKQE